jgi:pyruvate/2-oxoglutarate dehydrogenase complex dihydrolipoamide dehydrogenase (E3) component
MKTYDVIVIGAGSAGLGNAGVANTIGLKTLLVEKDPNNFGGDCTNYGCIPSKALIHVARLVHQAKQAQDFGIQTTGQVDMQKVLDYVHRKQAVIKSEENPDAMRAQGMDVAIGFARFVNKNTIEVDGQSYSAKLILLCTGSSPRMLDLPGMDQIPVYTNETLFFDCKTLPKDFVVIGGGAIGCEMAQAFARLGSNVYIVNRGARLLEREHPKVSEILEKRFEEEGIQCYHQAEVKAFKTGKVILKMQNGPERNIPCDAALLAIGRVVNTEKMQLDKAGIQLTEKGKIQVNTYLQSTNSKVYVLGDAAGKYMLSHGAEKMVRQLWRNLIIPFFKKKNTTKNLSWVTFTDPEIATFGWDEPTLSKNGVNWYRQDQAFDHDDRAIVEDYQYGHLSLWMSNGSSIGKRHLLSGTMIAPHAGEMMQELQLAAEEKIPISAITGRVYPYPVGARINQKALRGVMDKTYTESKKKLARWAFRLFH